MFPLLIPAAFLGVAYYVSRPSYTPMFGGDPGPPPRYPSYVQNPHMPLNRQQMLADQYGSIQRSDLFGAVHREDLFGADGVEYDEYDEFDEDEDGDFSIFETASSY